MASSELRVQFRKALVKLYSEIDDIKRVLDDAGVNRALIDLSPPVENTWASAIQGVEKQNKLAALFRFAAQDYPEDQQLRASYNAYCAARQQEKLLNLFNANGIRWTKLLTLCQDVLSTTTPLNVRQNSPEALLDFLWDLPPQDGKVHRPIFEFVDELARAHSFLAPALAEWNMETATLLGWKVPEITPAPSQLGASSNAPSSVYVLVEIGCDQNDRAKKLYNLDIRLWVDETPLPSLFCERNYLLTIEAIHQKWDEVFQSPESQRWLAIAPENVYLEFIVPCELLSDDFENWSIPGNPFETYGTIYPVVVRSYDRLHNKLPFLRQWWTERTTKAKKRECTFEDQTYTRWVCDPTTLDPRTLYRTWRGCEELVCLKLAYPPAPIYDPKRSDSAALWLEIGVPVAVWCRPTNALQLTPDEIRQQIGELVGKETSLTKLPQRFIEVRFQAGGDSTKLGSHLVLFWDDASRRPSLNNEAPVYVGP